MSSNVFPEQFKGLWIPAEFLQLIDITILDACTMARVAAFQQNGCFMSNANFSLLFGVPKRTIEDRIAHLLSKGLLINRGQHRGKRLLFVNMDMVRQQLTS